MGRIHNIEGKKNKMDSLRSTAFTKHARNITVAARQGGGDPAYNAALKLAIDKAKADNMPNDNINRAIKKASVPLMVKNMNTSHTKAMALVVLHSLSNV